MSIKVQSSFSLADQDPLTQLTPLFLLKTSWLLRNPVLQVFFLIPWHFLFNLFGCFSPMSLTPNSYNAQALWLFSFLSTLTATVISFSFTVFNSRFMVVMTSFLFLIQGFVWNTRFVYPTVSSTNPFSYQLSISNFICSKLSHLIILHKPFPPSLSPLLEITVALTKKKKKKKHLRFALSLLYVFHKFHTKFISKCYWLYLQNRYQIWLLLTTSIVTILVEATTITTISYLDRYNSQSNLPTPIFIINSKHSNQSAPVNM